MIGIVFYEGSAICISRLADDFYRWGCKPWEGRDVGFATASAKQLEQIPSGSLPMSHRAVWFLGPTPCPSCPGVPATLAILSASWFFGVLERFWLRCLLPVDRVLRRWTSVALKKATMKGCLFWGPCRPIRPASLGLMLCPRQEVANAQRVGRRRSEPLRADRCDRICASQLARAFTTPPSTSTD
jgi:hypothetical protein